MKRIHLNVNDEAWDVIRTAMAEKGITGTEFIRRSIAYYKFIEDARKAGKKVLLEDKRGRMREVEFL